MTGSPTRVFLVDDHPLVRTGLSTLLDGAPDLQVIGQAGDGAAAVAELVRIAEIDPGRLPDVVLMDLSMPGLDGVAATQALRRRDLPCRVVVLTSFTERDRVRDALAAGAIGYVLKDSPPDELIAAVRAAAAGQVPLDPRVAGALLPDPAATTTTPAEQLSDRETQVLRLAAKGLANKQIGRALGITERTVKVHLGNVFRRIGVADRTSAALWARDHLPPEAGSPG